MIKILSFVPVFFLCLINVFAQNWVQMGVDINGEGPGDQFGYRVSITPDGSTIAVGAAYNDGKGRNAGHARVFTWNGTTWTQKGSDIDGEAAVDYSREVSLSSDGNILAIGATHNDGNGQDAGHVRVYTWSGSNWTQKGSDVDGEAANDLFGVNVSMSSDGNTLAIGANENDGNGTNAGHVRVFTWSGSAWIQKGSDIDGEAAGDQSGYRLSISSDGNTVAIGAPYNDGNGADAGHVRVFSWSGSAWTQKGSDIDGEAAGDNSREVSLSPDGKTLAIGAPLNDGNGQGAGQVRVFTWSGSNWTQKGSDIDGEAKNDLFGVNVSMSSDGNKLAIGAHENDGNGTNSGHVRVFTWSGSAWTQKGSDIDGEAAGDAFGGRVGMSSDGNTLVVGAGLNDGNGSDAGHVRVFRYGWPLGITPQVFGSAKIYPNPTNEKVTIDFGGYLKVFGHKVLINNGTGQQVFSKDVTSRLMDIDFNSLGSAGIYMLTITDKNLNILSIRKIVLL